MKWPNGFKAAFALRVDVEASSCLLRGIPALWEILEEHEIKASFFIPMGPDRTWLGFNWARAKSYLKLEPLRKFGLKTIMRGLLSTPSEMGRLCIESGVNQLRGCEFALHGYDHAGWVRGIRRKAPGEVKAILLRGICEYRRVFGRKPLGFASPEFKWTAETLRLLDELGFKYGSDFRADAPFKPVINGLTLKTIQIPVTLPNLEELSWAGLSDNEALKAILKSLEAKINSGRLAVLLIHPSYEALWKRRQLETVLRHVAENRGKLWITTMDKIAEWASSTGA